MIRLIANITNGCTAQLEVKDAAEAARYIWGHRQQADSWEIFPDDAEAEIRAELNRLAS